MVVLYTVVKYSIEYAGIPRAPEDVWLPKVVAESYRHRVQGHQFWKDVFMYAAPRGVALKQEDFLPYITDVQLVREADAKDMENAVGSRILATPGCIALRDSAWNPGVS